MKKYEILWQVVNEIIAAGLSRYFTCKTITFLVSK
jgi:hypothetical protein